MYFNRSTFQDLFRSSSSIVSISDLFQYPQTSTATHSSATPPSPRPDSPSPELSTTISPQTLQLENSLKTLAPETAAFVQGFRLPLSPPDPRFQRCQVPPGVGQSPSLETLSSHRLACRSTLILQFEHSEETVAILDLDQGLVLISYIFLSIFKAKSRPLAWLPAHHYLVWQKQSLLYQQSLASAMEYRRIQRSIRYRLSAIIDVSRVREELLKQSVYANRERVLEVRSEPDSGDDELCLLVTFVTLDNPFSSRSGESHTEKPNHENQSRPSQTMVKTEASQSQPDQLGGMQSLMDLVQSEASKRHMFTWDRQDHIFLCR